jgi:hypothetical protein
VTDDPVGDLLAISAPLTGFDRVDLEATGMASVYLAELLDIAGNNSVAELLAAGMMVIERAGPRVDQELRRRVLTDPNVGPLARNLVILWYTGQWAQLPAAWRDAHGESIRDTDHVVSAEAYKSGLVWTAIGAHPQGARPQGFGAWAEPPPDLYAVAANA